MFHRQKYWNNAYGEEATCDYDETLIKECNVTGTWTEYDPDVDIACQTYDNKCNKLFKNVFCYVCNPPQSTGRVLNSCNNTGLWERNNENIEKGCNLSRKTTLNFPFKNFYCYLCNNKETGINTACELKTEITASFSYHLARQRTSWHFNVNVQSLHLYLIEIISKGEKRKFNTAINKTVDIYFARRNFSSVTFPTCDESGEWLHYDDVFFCRDCNQMSSAYYQIQTTILSTQTIPSFWPPLVVEYRIVFAFSNFKLTVARVTLSCN